MRAPISPVGARRHRLEPQGRHCERSEAIHDRLTALDCFAALAMTNDMVPFALVAALHCGKREACNPIGYLRLTSANRFGT
ncbi:hypothetical protein [Novosphingobium kaempferiae]|uniref:hypothetical protein n=1 Tax=Novosphingobium kaempferiae TaxID=2896849 RepID=UPI001E59229A|nr:hypothetical protein [Novosphingobium kaempferiae]